MSTENFYNKPLQLNTNIGLPKIAPSTPIQYRAALPQMFQYNSSNGVYTNVSSPLNLTGGQIEKLALNNANIMRMINDNKLWEY